MKSQLMETTEHFLMDAAIYKTASRWHWQRSFAKGISPAKRKFHRRAAKEFGLKSKAAKQMASFDWQKFCEAHQPK